MDNCRDPEGSTWWFACRICKRAFPEVIILKTHTREVHGSTSAAYGLILSETPDLAPTITVKPCASNLGVQVSVSSASGGTDATEVRLGSASTPPTNAPNADVSLDLPANHIKKPAGVQQMTVNGNVARKILYDCGFCDKTYPTQKSLSSHTQNVHSSTEI